LWGVYSQASETKKDWMIFPVRYREALEEIGIQASKPQKLRIVSDLISGMTELQAVELAKRFSGTNLGSVLDSYAR